MKLLRYLTEANLDDVTSRSHSLSNALNPTAMDQVQKNIRNGAKPNKETGQFEKWANALDLVHKAYEVAGVQRPTPDMQDAWKQYEENITYAVQQLAKARGVDADWRTTSADLHEALHYAKTGLIRIDIIDGNATIPRQTLARSFEEVRKLMEHAGKIMEHDVRIDECKDGHLVTFWKHNIKKNYSIIIRS
jgi:hypothetical protein